MLATEPDLARTGGSPDLSVDPRAQAQAIVDAIHPVRGSTSPAPRHVGRRVNDKKGPGIRVGRRLYVDKAGKPPRKSRKRKASDIDEGDENEEGSEETNGTDSATTGAQDEGTVIVRPRRRRKARTEGEDTGDDDGTITRKVGRKRGSYKTAGVAGTTDDRRLSTNKKKKEDTIKFVRADLENVQPGDTVGDDIDVNVLTMADLATHATHGKVSARAIKLDDFTRQVAQQKKRENEAKRMTDWQRQQILRRKVRSIRNADRQRRRAEFAASGEADINVLVSADEMDSEEEYEVVPDRLTPPPGPQRVTRVQPMRIGPEPEPIDHESMFETAQNEVDEEGAAEMPDWAYEDIHAEAGEGEVMEEEDEETALRAAGISIVDDGQEDGGMGRERGDEEEDEDEEDEEPDWDNLAGPQYDADAYRDDIAEKQRRNLEEFEGRTVLEEDDETKMINARTYSRHRLTERWTRQETELFYAVLGETGLNPTMLKPYFPGRTQKQLKNKMNRELHKDSQRVYAALDKRREIGEWFAACGVWRVACALCLDFGLTSDVQYLAKSSGYDPNKEWDKEDALIEEARRDRERLRRVDAGLEEETMRMEGDGGEIDPALQSAGLQVMDEDPDAKEGEQEDEEVYADGLFYQGPDRNEAEDNEEEGEESSEEDDDEDEVK